MTFPTGKERLDVEGLTPTNPTSTVVVTSSERRAFVHADALDRAWRTFKTGIGLDIALGLALTLGTMLTDLRWTKEYWALIGTLAAKSVVQSIVSYILRKRSTPKVGLQA